jgi:hypothetical protein
MTPVTVLILIHSGKVQLTDVLQSQLVRILDTTQEIMFAQIVQVIAKNVNPAYMILQVFVLLVKLAVMLWMRLEIVIVLVQPTVLEQHVLLVRNTVQNVMTLQVHVLPALLLLLLSTKVNVNA